MKSAKCIKCGCTDDRACPGGCSWVWVDRKKGKGLCSQCGPTHAPDQGRPNE